MNDRAVIYYYYYVISFESVIFTVSVINTRIYC